MFKQQKNGFVHRAKNVSELIPSILQKNCFEQRSHLGQLVERWKEIFDHEFGELVERNGDVLIIKVKGAPLRSELENFKKWDMLEILQMEEEFSGIRDLQFRE
jgi:hypothetical protein